MGLSVEVLQSAEQRLALRKRGVADQLRTFADSGTLADFERMR